MKSTKDLLTKIMEIIDKFDTKKEEEKRMILL